MQWSWLCLILWLLNSQVCSISTEGINATLYTLTGHRGRNVRVKGESCVDLEPIFHNNVASINTHGGCVVLHALKGCKGVNVEVKLSTPGHWDLANIDFANEASSIGPCEDCQALVEKQKLEFPTSTKVSLYMQRHFGGRAYEVMNITGCTPIPPPFSNQILSTRTDGNCYELHQNLDCSGESRELSSVTNKLFHSFDVLEFIGKTGAISLCHYRCQMGNTTSTSSTPLFITDNSTKSTSSSIEIHATSTSSSTPSTTVNSSMPYASPPEIEASSTSSSNTTTLRLDPIDNLIQSTSSQNQNHIDSSYTNSSSHGFLGLGLLLVSLTLLIIIIVIVIFFTIRRRQSRSESRGSLDDMRFSLLGRF